MDVRTDVRRRLDLHNVSIDFAAANAGRCGFTHLDSGRVCSAGAPAPRPLSVAGPPRGRRARDRRLARLATAGQAVRLATTGPSIYAVRRGNEPMHREVDAVRTTRSVAVLERRLPAIRSELDEQRRFRIEQLRRP